VRNAPRAEGSTPTPEPVAEGYDFSLILGGPLYQLFQRAYLAGPALEMLRRRLLVTTLFAWLPLLVLSVAAGDAWGSGVAMPFLRDLDAQVRFLVALPLLLLAEIVVHDRMRPVVGQFVGRHLIAESSATEFAAALASFQRLRNSVIAELAMIALVYGVGVRLIWQAHTAISQSSWYGVTAAGTWEPSLAGWWLAWVSLPLFQFMLLRWYFRLFVWGRFLWKVSRMELKLMPTHPDRCGGLGFLSGVSAAFAPFLMAQGAVMAGSIANQIFFGGAKLPQFKLEVISLVVGMLLAVVGPLLVFVPVLARAKRFGLREYGALAHRYVREFDQKWLRSAAAPAEPLVGSGDIQSLADFGNAYEIIRTMRPIPFSREALLQLVVFTVLPLVPLSLTMISIEQLVDRLLQVAF
jgi:hypothetical protein